MAVTMEETEVKKGDEVKGIARFPQFSPDQDGLKEAIDFYGGGADGIHKAVTLLNSQIRISEQGKIRNGTDPMKAARIAFSKLSKEQIEELLAAE